MQDIEKRVIGKVMWRLIPFLIVCYFVAYLDRVNVGFAKLHMNQALGLSEEAFGLGAGLFFVGYFLFEVPSNIFLERVGARVWIARIMITWGIASAAFAFIPSISAQSRRFQRSIDWRRTSPRRAGGGDGSRRGRTEIDRCPDCKRV